MTKSKTNCASKALFLWERDYFPGAVIEADNNDPWPFLTLSLTFSIRPFLRRIGNWENSLPIHVTKLYNIIWKRLPSFARDWPSSFRGILFKRQPRVLVLDSIQNNSSSGFCLSREGSYTVTLDRFYWHSATHKILVGRNTKPMAHCTSACLHYAAWAEGKRQRSGLGASALIWPTECETRVLAPSKRDTIKISWLMESQVSIATVHRLAHLFNRTIEQDSILT